MKGTRFRPCFCQNTKRSTKRKTCKSNAYIQRHTTIRILAEIIKYSTNNNDTQTWEKFIEHFILPTNQLNTDNFKSTRKDYTKKINK